MNDLKKAKLLCMEILDHADKYAQLYAYVYDDNENRRKHLADSISERAFLEEKLNKMLKIVAKEQREQRQHEWDMICFHYGA